MPIQFDAKPDPDPMPDETCDIHAQPTHPNGAVGTCDASVDLTRAGASDDRDPVASKGRDTCAERNGIEVIDLWRADEAQEGQCDMSKLHAKGAHANPGEPVDFDDVIGVQGVHGVQVDPDACNDNSDGYQIAYDEFEPNQPEVGANPGYRNVTHSLILAGEKNQRDIEKQWRALKPSIPGHQMETTTKANAAECE